MKRINYIKSPPWIWLVSSAKSANFSLQMPEVKIKLKEEKFHHLQGNFKLE